MFNGLPVTHRTCYSVEDTRRWPSSERVRDRGTGLPKVCPRFARPGFRRRWSGRWCYRNWNGFAPRSVCCTQSDKLWLFGGCCTSGTVDNNLRVNKPLRSTQAPTRQQGKKRPSTRASGSQRDRCGIYTFRAPSAVTGSECESQRYGGRYHIVSGTNHRFFLYEKKK